MATVTTTPAVPSCRSTSFFYRYMKDPPAREALELADSQPPFLAPWSVGRKSKAAYALTIVVTSDAIVNGSPSGRAARTARPMGGRTHLAHLQGAAFATWRPPGLAVTGPAYVHDRSSNMAAPRKVPQPSDVLAALRRVAIHPAASERCRLNVHPPTLAALSRRVIRLCRRSDRGYGGADCVDEVRFWDEWPRYERDSLRLQRAGTACGGEAASTEALALANLAGTARRLNWPSTLLPRIRLRTASAAPGARSRRLWRLPLSVQTDTAARNLDAAEAAAQPRRTPAAAGRSWRLLTYLHGCRDTAIASAAAPDRQSAGALGARLWGAHGRLSV
jgi:hypothetical protein